MPRDLTDLARSFAELPGNMQKAQTIGINKAALHMTTQIRTNIRAASGGDMKLSGVGRSGARVNARYDVKGTVNPTAVIKGTGPIKLIEQDTSGHEIKTRRKKALHWDGKFAKSVHHPGTTGKHPFEKGVNQTQNDTPRIFDEEVQKAIRSAFT